MKRVHKNLSFKRRLLLLFLILYATVGVASLMVPYFYEELKGVCFWVYMLTAAPFAFQVIYVTITDSQEFEAKLFKQDKTWKE